LQTIGPAITAVAALGFRILFHFVFEVRARQVVEQDLEIGDKQIRPFLSQEKE